MRVLVADDNPVFLAVLEQMLLGWGYEVVIAADGIAAWNILQSEGAPRLAILDWMMPGMDGIEVCRCVRASRRLRDSVYILVLTSKTAPEDLTEALDAGADDFVQKPFKSPELRARIRNGERILRLPAPIEMARQRRPSPPLRAPAPN